MRYAQEHWLKLQAQRAIKYAALTDEQPYAVIAARHWIDALHENTNTKPKRAIQLLKEERERVLKEASNALVRAEILHREIVSRGGKG